MDAQYLPMREATVSVLDNGFLHSDATYDVVHVWDGAFFRLDDHVDRFLHSMQQLHMSIDYTKSEIKEILHNIVALPGLRNAYVEIICTRGISSGSSRDPRDCDNRFMAFAIPFGSIASTQQMEDGLHIAVTDILRIPPSSIDPTVKNYHWLDMIKAFYQAYNQGADTAILLNTDGNIAEGPGFNIFTIKDGVLKTPKLGVLQGITRQTIFDIFQLINLDSEETAISVDDLKNADEVFITSTAGGVCL